MAPERVISLQVKISLLSLGFLSLPLVNLPSAIRFVLSDAYNNLSREERQSLLHVNILF